MLNNDAGSHDSESTKGTPTRKPSASVYLIFAALIVVVVVVCVWWFAYQRPHNKAVSDFNAATASVQAKNTELDIALARIGKLTKSNSEPLDSQTLLNAKHSITAAKRQERSIGKIPSKTADIEARTIELGRPLNYDAAIADLDKHRTALDASLRQMKQVTNPTSDFVVSRLKGVPNVENPLPVAMTHDPNGNLNKPRSYVAAIYFASPEVDHSVFDTADVIDNGTDGGGQIEVYKTAADVQKRNTYLSAFDGGGMMDSGSHVVLGTMLIRTSRYLNAEQQAALTAAIRSALIKL